MGDTISGGLLLVLTPLILLVAGSYASVGLGGGTGYLAVMALAGMPPRAMAPTALLLNIIVTGMALLRFGTAGRLPWRLFVPFFAAAVPAAFVGGFLQAPRAVFLGVLAIALAGASIGMLRTARGARERAEMPPRSTHLLVAIPTGGAIGLLSGFLGVGGGVFLGPLILFLGWAGPKQVAAMNSALILVVSAVALAAHGMRGGIEIAVILPLGAAALVGGLVGATLAEKKLSAATLQRVFAVIVFLAAAKAGFDAIAG